MKRIVCYLGAVLSFLFASAAADIISGNVTDSASGKGLYHVRVSTDSAHFVLTDSSGTFSINTASTATAHSTAQDHEWNTIKVDGGNLVVPANSGMVSVKILTILGTLAANYHLGNLSVNEKVSFAGLPQGTYLAEVRIANTTTVLKVANLTNGSKRSVQASVQGSVEGSRGDAKFMAVNATTTLTFSKSAYYSKVVTNPVTGLVVPLMQNYTPSRHDFIYAGEWQNGGFANQKFFVYRGGKQVFSYTYPDQCEYGDIWMLSNGNIVYSYRWGGAEMTGTGTETWNWADPLTNPTRPQADVHTAQPVGPDRVLVYSNGDQTLTPPISAKMILINTKTKQEERFWIMPGAGGSHNQSRHARMTKAGTLLVAHQDLGKVAEYDTSSAKEIWAYTNCGLPWSAVRLRNGNTLVSGNQAGWIRIVNPKDSVVWELNNQNCPPPNESSWFFQEVSMLDNGNVIACNQQAPDNTPGLLEISVTNPPKIVWSVLGKDLPGGISTCQILDDPGVPEDRDLQR